MTFYRCLAFLFCFNLLVLSNSKSIAQMRQVYLDNVEGNEVRKISFYSASEGYVAFRDWIGYTADSGKTFTPKYITLSNVNFNSYSVNLTFGFGIKGIKAFDANNIIVYGDYGLVPAILSSSNAGATFKLIFLSQYNPLQLSTGITDMIFPQNGSTGYAIDADRILKTTDKGLTWSVTRADAGSFFDHLEAVDINTVFAMNTAYTGNKLIKTTNGGTTWQAVTMPAITNDKMSYAHFFTASIGWLSFYDSNNQLYYFYKTTDGGTTWVLQNNTSATPFNCGKMKFIDENTGYALSGQNTVYKTLNSGITWEPLPRDNNYAYLGYTHNDLFFLNSNQFWAGGGHGFLEMSSNAGGTPLPKAYFRVDTTGVNASSRVNLYNYSNSSYQFKWYVNNVLVGTTYNLSYTHLLSSQADSIKLVVTSNLKSDTTLIVQYFYVPNLPKITSFFPTTGSKGTLITISGTGFDAVTNVYFAGISASSFKIVSSNQIQAIVASGGTGSVSVKDIHGTSALAGFVYFQEPTSAPPIISSIQPEFGSAGTDITITGSGFGTTAIDNTVFFGSVAAKVKSANSNQIICEIPFGASFKYLSVLNKNTNLQGQSTRQFFVTHKDSGNFTTNSFLKTYSIDENNSTPRVSSLKTVVGKDMDGDGKPDIIVCSSSGVDFLYSYRNLSNNGDFIFDNKILIAQLGYYNAGYFDVEDLDGDGKPDIVADVKIFRNNSTVGTIKFDNPIDFPSLVGGVHIITDLDNDGKNDLIGVGYSNQSLITIRNTSSPGFLSFESSKYYTTSGYPLSIEAGDFDGDGKKDIVTYSQSFLNNTNSLSVFRNISTRGNVILNPSNNYSVTFGPTAAGADKFIYIVDYDVDGKLDMLVLNAASFTFFRNISTVGNIAFAQPIILSLNPPITNGLGGAIGNLGGDNKIDFVMSNWSDLAVHFFKNKSIPGNVINNKPIKMAISGYANAIADFNLDGKMDYINLNDNISYKAIEFYKNMMGVVVKSAFCVGITNTLVSDVAGLSYKWQKDTGSGYFDIFDDALIKGSNTNTLIFNNTPITLNGNRYRCIVDSLKSSVFSVQTNGSVPSIKISTASSKICTGNTATFKATVTNGTSNMQFYWQVNGVNMFVFSDTFTSSTLKNNDKVTVGVSVYGTCNYYAQSDTIVMSVTGNPPPSLNLVVPNSTICTGTPITLSAVVTGGVNLTYEWKLNGTVVGTNSPTYTGVLQRSDAINILVTSVDACGVTYLAGLSRQGFSVENYVAPSVSISTPTSQICNGTNVVFTATPTNGGISPIFQWKNKGVNVGNNGSTYTTSTLKNGDSISVLLTSNFACLTTPTANSNFIAVTVQNSNTPTIALTGNNVVTKGLSTKITSAITNGGTSPTYQWQDSTSTHGWQNITGQIKDTIAYTPNASGDAIRCVLTSNIACATQSTVLSVAISFTVNNPTAIIPVNAITYGVKYYPNPVVDLLSVEGLRIVDKWESLEIKSVTGAQLALVENINSRTKLNLDISHLTAGFYIAVLKRKQGEWIYFKFVKQ